MAIARGYSYTIMPITWRSLGSGVAKPSIDEVMAEVHRHKVEIAPENQFDLEKLISKLQGRQEKSPRLVRLLPPAGRVH